MRVEDPIIRVIDVHKAFGEKEVLKGVNPGQPVRYEPVKSRFEPLTLEGWTKTYYASPVDFGGGIPGSQPNTVRSPSTQPHVD